MTTNIVILNNWSLVSCGGIYDAPELYSFHLEGQVTNHPRFPSGHPVTTSRVIGYVEDNETGLLVLTKSGSAYQLGQVDPDYEKAFPNAEQRFVTSLKEECSDSM